MLRKLGSVLKTTIATIGFFGFLLSFLGFLNTTDGYHLPSLTWDQFFLLIAALGVTGAVSTFVSWKYSDRGLLLQLSLAILVTDYYNWSNMQTHWLKNHAKSAVELLGLGVGFAIALLLSLIVYKILVVPLSTNHEHKKILVPETIPLGTGRLKIWIHLFGGLLGSLFLSSTLPALVYYLHPVLVVAGITILLSLLVARLTMHFNPLFFFFGLLGGLILQQILALRIAPTHPLSDFMGLLPCFSLIGSIGLSSVIGSSFGKYLSRSNQSKS